MDPSAGCVYGDRGTSQRDFQDEYIADIHIIFVFLQAVVLRSVWKSAVSSVRPLITRL